MSFFSDQAGGGTPAASLKLHRIGDTCAGVIESIAMVDKKAYGTDVTELDSAGNPVKQLRVIISAQPDNYASASKALVDDNGQPIPDDGRRAIYIALNTNLSFRTAEALQALGSQYLERGLEVGGQFGVRYAEDIPTNKGNPARGHQVFYKPPAQSSGAMFATQAQPQQQPAPQGPPPGFAPQPQGAQGAWPPAQPQQPAPATQDPWQAQPQGYSAEPPF